MLKIKRWMLLRTVRLKKAQKIGKQPLVPNSQVIQKLHQHGAQIGIPPRGNLSNPNNPAVQQFLLRVNQICQNPSRIYTGIWRDGRRVVGYIDHAGTEVLRYYPSGEFVTVRVI
ncbi:hypothetical protein HYR99_10605 [Candidatus Poribacteria bacterium]|nr:hypothetical protein [Candidatus Poribacteria bacterium]